MSRWVFSKTVSLKGGKGIIAGMALDELYVTLIPVDVIDTAAMGAG
jgi:hypothetical protein